jgi:hypothetical protein
MNNSAAKASRCRQSPEGYESIVFHGRAIRPFQSNRQFVVLFDIILDSRKGLHKTKGFRTLSGR